MRDESNGTWGQRRGTIAHLLLRLRLLWLRLVLCHLRRRVELGELCWVCKFILRVFWAHPQLNPRCMANETAVGTLQGGRGWCVGVNEERAVRSNGMRSGAG